MYPAIAITALVLSVINFILLVGIIATAKKAYQAVKPMTELLRKPPDFGIMGIPESKGESNSLT